MISEYKNFVNPLFQSIIPVMKNSEQDGYSLQINGEIADNAFYLFDNNFETNYYPPMGVSYEKRLSILIPKQKQVTCISFKLAPGSILNNFYFDEYGVEGLNIGYYDFRNHPLTEKDGLIVLNVENVISTNHFSINIPNDNGNLIGFSEFQIYENKSPQGIQKITPKQIYSSTIHYENFEEQMSGMLIPYQEEFSPIDGQTEIILKTNYVKDNRGLQIILNGVMLNNKDYIEIDGKSILFNKPLTKKDRVVVRIEGAGGGVTLENTKHISEIPVGIVDGVNNVFELQYFPEKNSEQVYMNGILMSEGFEEDYQIFGKTITFEYSPPAGSKIIVYYRPFIG